ncbi:hypothetical protein ATO6_19775 [Oceanicola sp. 22II-s10i]|uniref:flavin-containing monooxygenase n=1 Tax=Oceanicola sp. 22II-s10i TaxID=1317116 RepID=UPI000B521771|nr:NAD(P)/FAD-dependent oxidoreductase [Oceanicola sp. 22II-s10i]OWU83107.1 hypothetical protein ATO6_19775 [Oceanicola sp. 22II-s10i]
MKQSQSIQASRQVDAIVVGAGFGGLQALHHLREQGLTAHLVEAGSDLGGTWYWNKYPGARVDIESLEYSYAFSEEIQQEWSWSERYSPRKDVFDYLNFVADKLDLRGHMQFDTRIVSATFSDEDGVWTLTSEAGETFVARHVFWALGFLSQSYIPDIPGRDTFKGTLVHTSRWPDEGIDLAGKRVGCVGVGATGVQFVPEVAKVAGHLSVFQRTPNWCLPQRNEPMREDYERFVKENYAEIRKQEHEQRGAGHVLFDYEISTANTRSPLDYSEEERNAIYEHYWKKGAIHITRGFFGLILDEGANDTLRAFWEKQIRDTVKDPETAEKLIPDFPPLTRRPCGEYGYYEAYNRDNVELIDCKANPIASICPEGVRLEDGTVVELDVLAFATGFDAGAGALRQIAISGRDGLTLSEAWSEGIRTHLGMMVDGFPNMYVLGGAQSPAAHFSPPLLVVYQTKLALRLMEAADALGDGRVEVTPEAVDGWTRHVSEVMEKTMVAKSGSWWMSANVPGKPRQPVAYAGGFAAYRDWAEKSLDDGFAAYRLTAPATT